MVATLNTLKKKKKKSGPAVTRVAFEDRTCSPAWAHTLSMLRGLISNNTSDFDSAGGAGGGPVTARLGPSTRIAPAKVEPQTGGGAFLVGVASVEVDELAPG